MASGNYSAVLGGHDNIVSGIFSFGLGRHVRATHDQAGVISLLASDNVSCDSAGDNSLSICADNGVYINGVGLDMAMMESRFETILSTLEEQVCPSKNFIARQKY